MTEIHYMKLKMIAQNQMKWYFNFQPFDRIDIFYTLTFDEFYLSLTLKRTEKSCFPAGLEKETSTNPEFATKN